MAQPRFSGSNEPRKHYPSPDVCGSDGYVEHPGFPFNELKSHSVSQVLFREIDALIEQLRDLDAKLLRRLAPIMREPSPVADGQETPQSGFAPLFDGVYSGIKAAQRLATHISDNLDLVDEL